jgi:hypothetical protein
MLHTVTLAHRGPSVIDTRGPLFAELGKYSGGISLSIQVWKFRFLSPLHVRIKHE